MRLLLDTHTLFWCVGDPSKVSAAAMVVLADPANKRLLSAATIWELAIKVGQGKLKLSMSYRPWMDKAIADLKVTILPVTVAYADRQTTLPLHHKDPFDRFMIAQAMVEAVPIVSVDPAFDAYGVTRIW